MDDQKVQDALPWLLAGAGFTGIAFVAIAALKTIQKHESGGMNATRRADAPEAVNFQGLTFNEWCDAAGVTRPANTYTLIACRQAWRVGEDPTEWKALLPVRRTFPGENALQEDDDFLSPACVFGAP